MALQSNDLFFVNRSNTTYKIKASEIGDFIVGDPNNGVPGYVNDGKLIVSDSKGAYDLFSANTKVDSVLDFDENFTLTNTSDGACVGIDFGAFKNNLICDVDSGFLDNNCECLAIDPEWISANLDFDILIENLICDDGSGLTNQNGCLAVDIDINGGGGIIINPDNGQIEINICEVDSGLTLDGGCLAVDFDQITENIKVCADGGIIIDPVDKCLAVDFDQITENIKVCAGGGIIIDPVDKCLAIDPNYISGGGEVIINPPTGGGSCSIDTDCDPKYICMGGQCVPDPDQWPAGTLWWHRDAVDGRMYVNYDDGTSKQWVDSNPDGGGIGGGPIFEGSDVHVGEQPPLSPDNGDLWYKTDVGRLFVWYEEVSGSATQSSQWVDTSPPAPGETGQMGKDGDSAYEVAVKNGYTGTEGEWLASLKGDPGDKGEKGDTGEGAAEISASEPAAPGDGEFWYDSSNNELKVYDGSTWMPVGGSSNGGGGGAYLPLSGGTLTGDLKIEKLNSHSKLTIGHTPDANTNSRYFQFDFDAYLGRDLRISDALSSYTGKPFDQIRVGNRQLQAREYTDTIGGGDLFTRGGFGAGRRTTGNYLNKAHACFFVTDQGRVTLTDFLNIEHFTGNLALDGSPLNENHLQFQTDKGLFIGYDGNDDLGVSNKAEIKVDGAAKFESVDAKSFSKNGVPFAAEDLSGARETFQELLIAVQNANDFGELKAAMLVALEDWA